MLTLLRIVAIPLVVCLLQDPTPTAGWTAMAVFMVASLTDFFDGWIARRYGLVTSLGKLLDPLADKLLVVSALIMLGVMDRQPSVPGWLLVVIVGREFAVTGLRSIAAAEGIVLAAEGTGKAKMLLQSVGLHFLIVHYSYFGVSFHDIGLPLLMVGTVVGLWSALDYHLRVFEQLRVRPG